MKTLLKSFLCFSLLFAGNAIVADDCCNTDCGSSSNDCNTSCNSGCGSCHSILVPRSVGADSARELLTHFGHEYDAECFNGGFDINLKYQDTWHECRLAKCLFGASTLNFKGSLVSGRDNTKDIIADYFGLGADSSSSVTFSPRIQNFVADFQIYLGLDEWWQGLYFRANLPLAHSWWNLQGDCNANCGSNNNCNNDCNNDCNSNCNNGTTTSTNSLNTVLSPNSAFNAGCMNLPTAIAGSAITALNAQVVAPAATLKQALSGDYLFGDMQEKWKYGRFNFCKMDDTKLADIDLILGYDFLRCEDYHFGLYLQAVAPTGTHIDQCYAKNIFAPIIGNGHHWEFGAGLSAHYEMWNCDDASLAFWLEGNVTHMFKNCQTRSFDFKANGCMSRYMLLKEFTKNTDGSYSYKGLINAINWTTRRANVSVDVKGDATLELLYKNCDWQAGIGFNFYGNSKEDVCIVDASCDSSLNNRYFGIKGCTPVAYIDFNAPNTGNVLTTVEAVVDGSTFTPTNSKATAYNCTTTPAVDNLVAVTVPTNHSYFSPCTTVTQPNTNAGSAAAFNTGANNSNPPVILANTNLSNTLDANSAATPRQISYKLYGHVDYEWSDCDWKPYLGLAAEVEFAQESDCCTPNMWGVYLKGGISF